jgi:hypothetical protein
MSQRLLKAAYQMTQRGWFVFPLQVRGKRPIKGFTRWEERATRDPEAIYTWWSEAPYNIGIATGPSSLLVVDCDQSRGDTPPPQWADAADGIAVLQRRAHDAGQVIPDTFSVRTPSGGAHLYFRAPDSISLGNTAGKLGWHVDTRGIGGYVVGPGSVTSAGPYTVVADRDLAYLPGWMTEALAPKTELAQAEPQPRRYSERYLQAILDGEARRITSAHPGSRNNALNIAAFRLGKLVGRGELTEQEAVHLLTEGARVHVGLQGFTEGEMHRTIRSGLTAGHRGTA